MLHRRGLGRERLLCGRTAETNFPVVNAIQPTNGGQHDAVLAKLNPAGSALVYSTYLGGSEHDHANDIAVDAAGNAYLAGMTQSANFPTVNPLQPQRNGPQDAFAVKVNPSGSALVYSTYLGGSTESILNIRDSFWAVAVDTAGNAYLKGSTSTADFPTTPGAFDRTANQAVGQDGVVTKLNAAGSALVYSTYLGGSQNDFPASGSEGIAVDAAGRAYVGSLTNSPDFPVTPGAYDTTHNGNTDGHVTVLNQAGSALVYSTFLGGSAQDSVLGLALDSLGNVHVAGSTGSTDFPTVNPTQPTSAGGGDGFVATLDPTGSTLLFSTYFGGTGVEGHGGLAIDPAGNLWVVGYTTSTDLPTVSPLQASRNGPTDAFLAKFSALAPPPPPPAAPSNLTATAVSQTRIDLAWQDNAGNESGFRIERWNGSAFLPIATVGANTTSFSNTGLAPATTYTYRVLTFNAGGDSAWSNVAFATTPQVPPAAPTNLTATALSSSEVRLNWNEVSGEQGYRIERREGNDPFAFVANVAANTATHTDGGLQPNKVYVYRVLAFSQAGNSDWSNEASARTLRDRPLPPHSLTAAAISATQVDLAWSDENEDEQGFLLERSENAGVSWSQVASLPANVTRGSDTSAQGGRNYQYRLKAWNDVGQSDPSNVASVSTPAAVALASLTVTPAAVRGRRNATGKVTLTCAAPSGGVSVTLASSNVAASVPSSVTVAAGATEATFTVTTARVRRNTRVTLTATLGAVQKTATLTVRK